MIEIKNEILKGLDFSSVDSFVGFFFPLESMKKRN